MNPTSIHDLTVLLHKIFFRPRWIDSRFLPSSRPMIETKGAYGTPQIMGVHHSNPLIVFSYLGTSFYLSIFSSKSPWGNSLEDPENGMSHIWCGFVENCLYSTIPDPTPPLKYGDLGNKTWCHETAGVTLGRLLKMASTTSLFQYKGLYGHFSL